MVLEVQGIDDIRIFENMSNLSYSSHLYDYGSIILKNACIFCGSSLKGNFTSGFYCNQCNLIYSWEDITKRIPKLFSVHY